jgi:hypothetical protein
MRRVLLGSLVIAGLLFGAIGSALAQGRATPGPSLGEQCSKFHFPKAPARVSPADYARCVPAAETSRPR